MTLKSQICHFNLIKPTYFIYIYIYIYIYIITIPNDIISNHVPTRCIKS